MKIEKLTDDKIRVIVNSNELNIDDDDSNIVISKVMESQDFFLRILKKAEKEVDFYTDGHKLLIEVLPSFEDFFIFTITKYVPNTDSLKSSSNNQISKKRVVAKRKSMDKVNKYAICLFSSFDVFCDFCSSIKSLHKFDYDKLVDNSSLYFWKDSYYLVLKNINIKSENSSLFYSMLSEFAKIISFSNVFESKLSEFGNLIIHNNAIAVGINFFAN